jgi:hypothetical protein
LQALKVKTITFHPNIVNDKVKAQKEALKNLEYFSGLYDDEIIFCIETFEGKRREFAPDETAVFDLQRFKHFDHKDQIIFLREIFQTNPAPIVH